MKPFFTEEDFHISGVTGTATPYEVFVDVANRKVAPLQQAFETEKALSTHLSEVNQALKEENASLRAENSRLSSEVERLQAKALNKVCVTLVDLLREAREVLIDHQKYLGRGFMGDQFELAKRSERVRSAIDAALVSNKTTGER